MHPQDWGNRSNSTDSLPLAAFVTVQLMFAASTSHVTPEIRNTLTYILPAKLSKLTNSMQQRPSCKAISFSPTFYGTPRFIIMATRPIPVLSQINLNTPSHHISLISNLILSSHPCLFPPGFPSKTLYAPLSSLIPATCPAHLNFSI